MGILPFFRFLRNFVCICAAFATFNLCLASTQSSLITDTHLVSMLFCFFVLWGCVIGNIVAENHHQILTWTLPHFRKRLMIWSAIVGLFSNVAWTIMLTFAPLNASWSTILLITLGFYCLGFALSGGWNFDVNRSGLIQAGSVAISLLVIALALFVKEVLAFGEQQKLGLAFIVFAITIWAFYVVFNQTTVRGKPFSLVLPLRSAFFGQTWKKNILNRRRLGTRVWHLDRIGTGIYNWLRAGRYENSGLGRWGWPFSVFTAVLAMVFFFLHRITDGFGLLGRSPYDFETLSKTIYHIIFYFDQLDSDIIGAIFVAVFFGICMYLFFPPLSLKRGYIYPLSRTQRMWIQYCSLLVQNISFFAASILVLGILGILAGIKVRFVSEGDISLRILCVLGWWVVLLPILQWLQVKYDLYDFQRMRQQVWGMAFLILVLILSLVFTGFTSLMRVWHPDLMLTYEVPILFLSFILLQWFLLARLKRYYATQDLI